MKFEVAIAIAIIWFVFRTINRAIKKNKANLQTGGKNNNNSTNATQNFVDSQTLSDQLAAAAQETEGRSLETIVDETSRRIVDPFLEEGRSLEENTTAQNRMQLESSVRSSHYNEDQLVEEYEQTHSQGRTVAHHKHQLFEDQKDRQKATRHTGAAGKPATARMHKSGHSPAPQPTGRAMRRQKPVHPVAAALKGKTGLKQAFVLAEVLKRPWE